MVAIDGEERFEYFVDPAALASRSIEWAVSFDDAFHRGLDWQSGVRSASRSASPRGSRATSRY